MVAATRMTCRFSTPGSSASCWALVNRWISSRNSTVCRSYRSRSRAARSMTARTSLTPAVTADSSTNRRPAGRGHEVGQGRLAGAGRSPDDRRQRAGRPRRPLDQPAQRAARAAARRPARGPRPATAGASARPAAAASTAPGRRRPPLRRPADAAKRSSPSPVVTAGRLSPVRRRTARHRAPTAALRLHRLGSVVARRARRVIVVWLVRGGAAFATAVGGVGGESLFDRLSLRRPAACPARTSTGQRPAVHRGQDRRPAARTGGRGRRRRPRRTADQASGARGGQRVRPSPDVASVQSPFLVPGGLGRPAAAALLRAVADGETGSPRSR